MAKQEDSKRVYDDARQSIAPIDAGDKTRFDAYPVWLQTGLFTRDQIRAMENMDPLPDGAGSFHEFD